MQSCSLRAAGDALSALPCCRMVAGFSCGLQNSCVPYGMEYLTGVPYGMEYCDERGAADLKIARKRQDRQVNACFPSDLGK